MRLVILAAAALSGCGLLVSDDAAVHAAENAGITNPVVTDTHYFFPSLSGCGKDDAVGFDVSGVNPQGRKITVTVCCGAVFKGCTVRY